MKRALLEDAQLWQLAMQEVSSNFSLILSSYDGVQNVDSVISDTNFQIHPQQKEQYATLVTELTKQFIHAGYCAAKTRVEEEGASCDKIPNPVPASALGDSSWRFGLL